MLSNECFAERYALTLRLMLAGLRRKTGALSTVPGTPRGSGSGTGAGAGGGQQLDGALSMFGTSGSDPFGQFSGSGSGSGSGGLDSLLSLPQMSEAFDSLAAQGDPGVGGDMMDFSWPTEFSPSNLPVWLQDGVSISFSSQVGQVGYGSMMREGTDHQVFCMPGGRVTDVYRTLRISDYPWMDQIRSFCRPSMLRFLVSDQFRWPPC